ANINVFLDEKEFHGRGGLDITDEMRLTVAGNACILLLNRPNNGFPGFKNILIYPETYSASQQERNGAVVVQSSSHRAGESWHRGPVILAWSDVIYGSKVRGDGFNVVLHEFAHKLDEVNSSADGVPLLDNKEEYMEWAQVFGKDYQTFIEKVQHRSDAAIDDYGATAPEEFFAVCTESFFEKPHALK
ncbi:MAG: zinc-dependent peptidase, partial [Pseudomonadales bacterium]